MLISAGKGSAFPPPARINCVPVPEFLGLLVAHLVGSGYQSPAARQQNSTNAPKPSPLGKVARRSRDGRGAVGRTDTGNASAHTDCGNPLPPPLRGGPPSPKGKVIRYKILKCPRPHGTRAYLLRGATQFRRNIALLRPVWWGRPATSAKRLIRPLRKCPSQAGLRGLSAGARSLWQNKCLVLLFHPCVSAILVQNRRLVNFYDEIFCISFGPCEYASMRL